MYIYEVVISFCLSVCLFVRSNSRICALILIGDLGRPTGMFSAWFRDSKLRESTLWKKNKIVNYDTA